MTRRKTMEPDPAMLLTPTATMTLAEVASRLTEWGVFGSCDVVDDHVEPNEPAVTISLDESGAHVCTMDNDGDGEVLGPFDTLGALVRALVEMS